jgi:hypothetical protein
MLSCHSPCRPRNAQRHPPRGHGEGEVTDERHHTEPADQRHRPPERRLREQPLQQRDELVDDEPDLVEEVQEDRVGVSARAE